MRNVLLPLLAVDAFVKHTHGTALSTMLVRYVPLIVAVVVIGGLFYAGTH